MICLTLLYVLPLFSLSLPGIFLCHSMSAIAATGALFLVAVLYGVMALGRK